MEYKYPELSTIRIGTMYDFTDPSKQGDILYIEYSTGRKALIGVGMRSPAARVGTDTNPNLDDLYLFAYSHPRLK